MRKARILIVEDETDVLIVNQKHLEEQGYEVTAAGTMTQARTALLEQPPDLIVLDVLLPDGKGYDFCAELRKITTAPVIFLTCMNEDADVIRGITAGGDDYITKPYNLELLSVRIMAQLRRAGLSGTGRIELPPLTVDLTLGQATLNGEDIHLSQKELQLLAFLASQAGREFSPSELYKGVWGMDMNGSSHTVQVYISRLRKKLRLGADCPFEINLNGNGNYIFIKVIF